MKYSDQQIIEAISSGDPRKREWALYQFCNEDSLQGWVLNYVKTHGGEVEDGEDVFQEVAVIFDRNIRQGRFDGKSTLRTYFFAIAKWHWVTYRRKKSPVSELKPEHYDGEVASVEAQIFEGEKKEILERAIAELDTRCQALLQYYKLDYSMKEIKELLGFSSSEMAKKQAYRCRERLRDVFERNPHLLHAINR
ncbi:MAG: sigma-70 family RNA polymerase sigma factor [Saprospiraceae bacterium]|nr:sigma-70 family RNA polymerase sigma factor [Saprospiraceae bacterium]MCF8251112.1 sigma-70 family RNA polymerase sigma factor [Saprospiraceae bacterium]MCF8281014.1 sigma-70 family RNA polymerase sigma factor [Bacteroidales bacterium]MCF8312930.1 sigma-70 family RNA polymerase sigma factor [Saprospiraceae bacterium]MCF8441371.1 sigma-70 family RNA polymerase sigma factor [Saprospiraceae bacterium]